MDAETERLIERTRQRRELLNQKMGKTPEAAPRKRRTPLSEDQTDNVADDTQPPTEDSPKRHCMRGSEQDIKPDTPAIPSVKSRLQNLASQHIEISEDSDLTGNKEEPAPVPTPRKSLSSPPPVRGKSTAACDAQENAQPGSTRKNRFAQLAALVNNWEDDLSHPTIVKEEEKKPRWQPPKPVEMPSTVQPTSSCKKTRAPLPPADTNDSSTAKAQSSPKRVAPSASTEKNSPTKLSAKLSFNSSPRPYQPYSENTKVSPVKSPAASKSNLVGDPEANNTAKPSEKVPAINVKDTPRPAVKTPSDRPLSTRLANWEQKISETKADTAATPKSGLACAAALFHTPRQTCTPAQPLRTPVFKDDQEVQMRPKVRKSIDDEPTAHPVSARMSAWEQISSAQVVSDIKKVKPGDSTPVRPPASKMPVSASKSACRTPSATLSLEPKKSFKDSIREKAAKVNPGSATSSSPNKSLSPKKASAAMKTVQEQLVHKTQSTDMAERLRQERMAELQAIQNRWKNGILKEGEEEREEKKDAEKQMLAGTPGPQATKRDISRERARTDTEDGESVNASWKVSETNKQKRVKLEHENNLESCLNPGIQSLGTMANLTVLDTVAKLPQLESLTNVEELVRANLEEKNDSLTKITDVPASWLALEIEPSETNLARNNPSETLVGSKVHCVFSTPEKGQRMLGSQCEGVVAMDICIEEATQIVSDISSVEAASEKKECVVTQLERSDQTISEDLSEVTNFDSKLASLGLEKSDDQSQKQSGLYPKLPAPESVTQKSSDCLYPNLPPPEAPPLPTLPASATSKVTGKPPRPNSLFNIVSQQKKESKAAPVTASSPSVRKVKFDDGFESSDTEALGGSLEQHKQPVTGIQEDISDQTDTTQDESENDVLRRCRAPIAKMQPDSQDDDDLSLSAFVPESVRRQSILPPPNQKPGQQMNTSFGSMDSFDVAPGAPPDIYKSTTNLVRLGQQYGDSSSSLDSSYEGPAQSKTSTDARLDDTEDTEANDRDAIGNLLEEAMESDSEHPSTSAKESPVQMRKRPSHRKATEEGSLPFSIDEYRASRQMQVLEVKQVITRNSHYVGKNVREEEVEMPIIPVPAPRQNIQERIKELQELVQQEQNIIMQTSNALNQCCSSASHFAGSQEQVECNRILLISCQKRQAFMTEIQRLRDTRTLNEEGPGPKGSLTISDIRLPLKKEFVTKIGTSHDTITYYFILLIRNGPQVICTQMLSTHDPMMRGSLDFPNLIKINGINGNFRVELEIYSMSVSKEALSKDKKKKTPKKMKGSALTGTAYLGRVETMQSPGGPMAVRTTSFSQVTSIQLNMRSLDKHSFNLDRLSHLSPLHGTIYMNLKCLMEASVEERGFLTMFEDVSGLGSWHRRWCVLSGNKLQFWKYPDDENRKDPMGYVDLKRCLTEKVGLISRDICARPNTFELEIARQPRKGERDTLVSRTYDTMTTVRHMLSADTKEERIVWCNKLNRALANIRTWHCDALRPSHPPHVKSSR